MGDRELLITYATTLGFQSKADQLYFSYTHSEFIYYSLFLGGDKFTCYKIDKSGLSNQWTTKNGVAEIIPFLQAEFKAELRERLLTQILNLEK